MFIVVRIFVFLPVDGDGDSLRESPRVTGCAPLSPPWACTVQCPRPPSAVTRIRKRGPCPPTPGSPSGDPHGPREVTHPPRRRTQSSSASYFSDRVPPSTRLVGCYIGRPAAAVCHQDPPDDTGNPWDPLGRQHRRRRLVKHHLLHLMSSSTIFILFCCRCFYEQLKKTILLMTV